MLSSVRLKLLPNEEVVVYGIPYLQNLEDIIDLFPPRWGPASGPPAVLPRPGRPSTLPLPASPSGPCRTTWSGVSCWIVSAA